MPEKKDSDLKRIKELIEIMKQNNLVEVEIKHGDDKIFLKRYQEPPAGTSVPTAKNTTVSAQAPTTEAEPTAAQPQPEENLVEITSPLVGTFYAAPSPESDLYSSGSPFTPC